MGRIYIDQYTGRLERTDIYLVRLTLKDGTVFEDLEPRRLFPITKTDMFITLLDKDEREVGFVRELAELDPGSRQVLEECFSQFYMIPKITQIDHCEEKFGSLKWFVQTDRGPITFRIRNRHSDIKQLYGTDRIIVRDANDNRYEIPDISILDKRSQRILLSYL